MPAQTFGPRHGYSHCAFSLPRSSWENCLTTSFFWPTSPVFRVIFTCILMRKPRSNPCDDCLAFCQSALHDIGLRSSKPNQSIPYPRYVMAFPTIANPPRSPTRPLTALFGPFLPLASFRALKKRVLSRAPTYPRHTRHTRDIPRVCRSS